MIKGRQLQLALCAIVLLSHLSQQSTEKGAQIYPVRYAFGNNTVAHEDTSCRRYSRGTLTLNGINTTEYFYCDQPGLLTDSDLGPERYSPNDTTQVYIWEPGVNQLLFTFEQPPKNITAIVIHYYRDGRSTGLPKARFCAVSVDSEIWNVTNSYQCKSQDEMRPGDTACGGMEPCRENVSIPFNYYADQVLMQIEDSKNYQFVVSEIEFFMLQGIVTTSGVMTTSTSTTVVNTDRVTTHSTTQAEETTEEELSLGGGGTGVKQKEIKALAAMICLGTLLTMMMQ